MAKAHETAQDNSSGSSVDRGLAGGRNSREAQEGEYVARARRRRLDLRSLAGTAREHGRVYRMLAEGSITELQAETRSRVLRRHSDILTTIEQKQQVADIQAALADLQSQHTPQLTHAEPAQIEDVSAQAEALQ